MRSPFTRGPHSKREFRASCSLLDNRRIRGRFEPDRSTCAGWGLGKEIFVTGNGKLVRHRCGDRGRCRIATRYQPPRQSRQCAVNPPRPAPQQAECQYGRSRGAKPRDASARRRRRYDHDSRTAPIAGVPISVWVIVARHPESTGARHWRWWRRARNNSFANDAARAERAEQQDKQQILPKRLPRAGLFRGGHTPQSGSSASRVGAVAAPTHVRSSRIRGVNGRLSKSKLSSMSFARRSRSLNGSRRKRVSTNFKSDENS